MNRCSRTPQRVARPFFSMLSARTLALSLLLVATCLAAISLWGALSCPSALAVRPVIAAGGLPFAPPDAHTVVLRSDGTLWAAGHNAYGQLGLGDTVQRTSFTQIGTDGDWVAVVCGGAHTIALKDNGTLWAWGYNALGQVGDGSTTNRSSPVQIGGGDWATAAAGMSHTLAVKTDGSLWAWGHNSSGELGDGSTTNRSAPVRIGFAGDWVGVACGYQHSAAWNSSGELWTWGDNASGQLGNNAAPLDSHVPQLIDSATDWASAAGGWASTVAQKASGRLWSWGWNSVGQLGLGDTVARHRPASVGANVDWPAYAQGADHALAVGAEGALWCWGWDTFGQLGLGDTVDRLTPTQIATVTGAMLVAAGFGHSLCGTDDGRLFAWGHNQFGQLGLGDTTDRLVPTPTTLKVDITGPRAMASRNVTVRWGKKAKLKYSLADEFCTQCTIVKMKVTKGTKTYKTYNLGVKNCGLMYTKSFTCKLARGTYKWQVFATDTAGNTQSAQNTKKLIVK